jgi:hypothetical protein
VKSSKHGAERTIALRLARTGQNIDLLFARVRGAAFGANGHVARCVDALRADEAQVHARLREMREADEAAWAANRAELGRRLDGLEAQLAIAQTRLRVEQAAEPTALEAAVTDHLAAWRAFADATMASATGAAEPVRGHLTAAVRALQERLAIARGTLHDPNDSALRETLLDLDRFAEQIAWLCGPIR